MELRDYQKTLSQQACETIQSYGLVMLAVEVRVGKTIIALETCKLLGKKRVLFITKKKAISSIEDDYVHYSDNFDCMVTNYENLHKVSREFDIVILDESHSKISGFPKASTANKIIKKNYSHLPMIYLSGTLLIESASKIYPQLSVNQRSPFAHYLNFYKWFKDYGVPKIIRTSYGTANDYSEIKYDMMMEKVQHLIVNYTQKEAGFQTDITEHILEVEMKPSTYTLIERIKKDRVIETRDSQDSILAETNVKLQSVLLQMYSGTIKLSSGKAITIDDSKAQFLKEKFKGKKIAILTCFVQEIVLLKAVFGDLLTTDLEEFKTTNKHYVGNIVSNREGVSLREADSLVFYNIPFSGTSFVQGRDRASYLGREVNDVYFICSVGGLERKVLKVVREKKNFSNQIFKKELGIK